MRCSEYRDISECKFLACQRIFPMHVEHETLPVHIGNLQTKPEYKICEKGAAANTHMGSGIFYNVPMWRPRSWRPNESEQSKGQLACPTVYLRGVIEVKNAHVQMNIYPQNTI